MLTNSAARAAEARARAYKLFDQGGLFLLVRPTGTKSWQQKYRWRGREKLLTFGQFPEIRIERARILQAEAKELLEQGIDPSNARGKISTVEQLARAWYRAKRPAWSDSHASDVLGSLERDIFSELGDADADTIKSRELLEAIRAIEARGCSATAHRVRQRLVELFAFGKAEGLVDANPAADLGAAMLAPPPPDPHPAMVDIGECRDLLAACEADAARPTTIMASRFLALTGVRLAAVRCLVWAELDLEERVWTIPAARMKLSRAKKDHARHDHIVPLSEAALWVLRGARAASIGGKPQADRLVFSGRGGGPIGGETIRELYIRCGYAGRHVPHGWRASFSTILNEDMGPDWRFDIDAALGHAGKGKVEQAYNRSQLLDRRRSVMDRWGEMLTG